MKPCVSWTVQKLLESIDNISPDVLRLCANPLRSLKFSAFSSPVCSRLLLQMSGKPMHEIVPIPKGPDKTLVQNYCPISLPCVQLKVLEFIIYKKITDFIQQQLSNQ